MGSWYLLCVLFELVFCYWLDVFKQRGVLPEAEACEASGGFKFLIAWGLLLVVLSLL